MRRLLLIATLLASALTSLAPAAEPSAPPFSDHLLRTDTPWGDGRAEIADFDATENRYGRVRPATVRHILVREHFAADAPVKADDWRAPGAYPVFKHAQLISVTTGVYRYEQGLTAFWLVAPRGDLGAGSLLKFTHTTNDSCGLSLEQGERLAPGAWRQRAISYWEGQHDIDARRSLPTDALFYDELPFRLRLLDWPRLTASGEATEYAVTLVPSVIGSQVAPLAAAPARLAAARTAEGWRVTLSHTRGVDHFVFAEAPPHALQSWTRADGSALKLRRLERLAYWELNRPEDEARLPR